MKKLLIAAVIFSAMGVAQGNAQEYVRQPDKFEDFQAKMRAAKGKEGYGYMDAAPAPAISEPGNPLGAAGDLPLGGENVPTYQTDNTALQSANESAEGLSPSPNSDPLAGMVVAKSEIKAVIVYNNRAKVTRVAEVEIPAGTHTVAFTDMPKSLFTDSLRAEGSAKAAVRFGAITQKYLTFGHTDTARERELRAKLAVLQDQKLPINAEKEAIQAQKKFLTDISQNAIAANEKLAENNLKADQWLSVAREIHAGMSETLQADLQQDMKLREINGQIQKVEAEIRSLQTPTRRVYAVLVPLETENATKLAIELSYQVPNATWHPLYDARISTNGKSDLKLVQYGSVRQQTGEDWSNVSLTLSTAQPRSASSLGYLMPMWVDAHEPPKQMAQGGGSFVPTPIAPAENQTLALPATPNAPQGDPLAEWRAKTEAKRVKMEQEQQPEEREVEQPEQVALFRPAVINTGGFISEYKIQGPSSVLNDGTDVKLLIGNFDVESKLQVHIKPQLSPDAYLIAHSKLKGDSPVLEGPVNLFRDEAYVGQSMLPLLRPGAEYDISFGVDDQVSVKHKVLKDERKQAGIISKDNFLERNYVTELQNLHNIAVDIVAQETVPTPLNEKVRVDVAQQTTTPGYVSDSENIKGRLDWQFKMEPKEKKELNLDWTVSWPIDYTLTGL